MAKKNEKTIRELFVEVAEVNNTEMYFVEFELND